MSSPYSPHTQSYRVKSLKLETKLQNILKVYNLNILVEMVKMSNFFLWAKYEDAILTKHFCNTFSLMANISVCRLQNVILFYLLEIKPPVNLPSQPLQSGEHSEVVVVGMMSSICHSASSDLVKWNHRNHQLHYKFSEAHEVR